MRSGYPSYQRAPFRRVHRVERHKWRRVHSSRQGTGIDIDDFHLSNAKIRFLGNNETAIVVEAGSGMKIYDQGHGTSLTFTFAIAGVVTIYDFEHDLTGHITYLNTATTQGKLTPSSDGHGGTWLMGAGLTLHLVNDPHISASQHS